MGDPIFKEGEDKHPSFGLVSLGRAQCSGGGMALFDSPFRHQHVITLSVSQAYRKRTHLHSDFISSNEELIEIVMSEAQFARMVTSPNSGVGTPCTISHVHGKKVPECPADRTKQTFQEETIEEFRKAAERARRLEELVERLMKKDRLNAEEKKAIKDAAFEARRVLDDHLPFLHQQFVESMDKIVQQAKTEIEAHINAVVTKVGIQGLREQLPRLEGLEKTK